MTSSAVAGPPPASSGADRGVVWLVAGASAVAGGLHLIAARTHLDDRGLAALFLAAALVQLAWAVALIRRPHPAVIAAGAAANAAFAAFYLLTRTTAVGVVSGLDEVQPVGFADAATAVFAVGAALGGVALLLPWLLPGDQHVRLGPNAMAGAVTAMFLLAAPAAALSAHDHDDHPHGGTEHVHAAAAAGDGHAHGDGEVAHDDDHAHADGDAHGADEHAEGAHADGDHAHGTDPSDPTHAAGHHAHGAGTTGDDHAHAAGATGDDHAHPSGAGGDHGHPATGGGGGHTHPSTGGSGGGHTHPSTGGSGGEHQHPSTGSGGGGGSGGSGGAGGGEHEHPETPTGGDYPAEWSAQQVAFADGLRADTAAALPRFASTAEAVAAGFQWIGDGGQVGGYRHYINVGWINDGRVLDPQYPESLVYLTTASGPVLQAAMYMLPLGTTMANIPADIRWLPGWHIHDNLCFRGNLTIGGLRPPGGSCPAGTRLILTPPMMHVWIAENGCGPFAGVDEFGLQCGDHEH